ncbi:hypothetical protein OAO58_00610, partial [bacterium]|nr:hypothetical protein [bacterium]
DKHSRRAEITPGHFNAIDEDNDPVIKFRRQTQICQGGGLSRRNIERFAKIERRSLSLKGRRQVGRNPAIPETKWTWSNKPTRVIERSFKPRDAGPETWLPRIRIFQKSVRRGTVDFTDHNLRQTDRG